MLLPISAGSFASEVQLAPTWRTGPYVIFSFVHDLLRFFGLSFSSPPKVANFCLCSALGQSAIFFTLANFDPLVCTTVTTTRKIFSVLLDIATQVVLNGENDDVVVVVVVVLLTCGLTMLHCFAPGPRAHERAVGRRGGGEPRCRGRALPEVRRQARQEARESHAVNNGASTHTTSTKARISGEREHFEVTCVALRAESRRWVVERGRRRCGARVARKTIIISICFA